MCIAIPGLGSCYSLVYCFHLQTFVHSIIPSFYHSKRIFQYRYDSIPRHTIQHKAFLYVADESQEHIVWPVLGNEQTDVGNIWEKYMRAKN